MKIMIILTIFLFFSGVLFGGLQFVLANRFATSGEEIRFLLKEEETLRIAHEALMVDVNENRSLRRIASRSSVLGFVRGERHMVLGEAAKLAYAP